MKRNDDNFSSHKPPQTAETRAKSPEREIIGGPVLATDDGTAAAPAHTFDADLDSGIYRIGANNLGVSVNGAKVVDVSTSGVAVTGTLTPSGVVKAADGTKTAPGVSFSGDTDTGLYRIGANNPAMSAGDTKVQEWTATGTTVTGTLTSTGVMAGPDGTNSAPGVTFSGDTNTGVYRIGADNLGVTAGGTKIIDVSTTGVAVTGTLSSTGVMSGAAVSAHYYRSSAFATAIPDATWEVMDFDTQQVDTHSAVHVSTATNKWTPTFGTGGNGWYFTAPVAGTYQCCASVGFTSMNVPSSEREVIIEWILNGGTYMRRGTRMAVGASNNQGVHCATAIKLAVNDVLQLRVYQATGGTKNIEALREANWITIDRIGS